MGRLSYIMQFTLAGAFIAFLSGPNSFSWVMGETITRHVNPSYLAAIAIYAAIGAAIGFVLTSFASVEDLS